MNKAVFVLGGAALFILVALPVQATQTASITVDGYTSDWAGPVPAAVDLPGDSACLTSTDIQYVFTAIDGSYAYAMVDIYDIGPISSTTTLEINFDYKDGQHFTNGKKSDIHLNVNGTTITAWTDNDLDGNMEVYPLSGYSVARNDVIELRIPLSELENAAYFEPTFVNLWEGPDQCDSLYVNSPAPVTAVDFSEWTNIYTEGDVSFNASGTTLEMSTPGTNAVDGYVWGNIGGYYSDAVGALATFNISALSTNSDNDIATGLRRRIGFTESGNIIEVQIYLSEYFLQPRIQYRIRERSPEGPTIKTYGRGIFGDYSDTPWTLNEDITIGFAVLGNTLGFYNGKGDVLAMYKFIDPVITDPSQKTDVFVSAAEGSTMTGTVKNMYILTAANLAELQTAGFIGGDTNLDGKVGLDDVIESLRILSGY